MAIHSMSSLASPRVGDLPVAPRRHDARAASERGPNPRPAPRTRTQAKTGQNQAASFASALPEFISAIDDIRTKPSYFDKGVALKKAYESGKTLVSDIDQIVNIAVVAEQLADKKVVSSTPLSWILLPLQAIALATGLYRVYKTNSFRKELARRFPQTDHNVTTRTRFRNTLRALQFLQTKNEKTLRDHLGVGEKSKVTQKVNALVQKLSSQNAQEKTQALQQCETLLKKLKTRVNKKIGFEIAATVMRVATITLSVLLLATPPSAILVAAVFVVAGIGMAISAYKKKQLPENPKFLRAVTV